LAVAALLLVLSPLRRWAERVATAAVPLGRPVHQVLPAERMAIYREQAEYAWADGTLTAKERWRLEQLRSRLGLTSEEAARVELEAGSKPADPIPATNADAAPASTV
ncbi:MAG TPA: hypothetical protein VI818_00280, partial [Candidatus Thermoplasmatota archaeon]|nr:hypothetical protein [Candidatus Thermoplasmatota archaeon]